MILNNGFVSDSLVVRKWFVSPTPTTLQTKSSSIKIPIYNVYASAGLINDENIIHHIEVDKASLLSYFGLTYFVDLSIITARGDSMLPTIPPNCKLLVQSKASLEKGMPIEEQICVIRIDNDIYIYI